MEYEIDRVTAVLSELLDDTANLLVAARQQKPRDQDEIDFWSRQHNALAKAAHHWAVGVRPAILGDAYTVPSATRPGAVVHRCYQVGGIWHCSCEAGSRGLLCWHHMLVTCVVRAIELAAFAARAAEPESETEGDTCPECDGAGCSTCDGSPLTDEEIVEAGATDAAPVLVVGAYIRAQLLASMLDRSAQRIAELRGQVTMPALPLGRRLARARACYPVAG